MNWLTSTARNNGLCHNPAHLIICPPECLPNNYSKWDVSLPAAGLATRRPPAVGGLKLRINARVVLNSL